MLLLSYPTLLVQTKGGPFTHGGWPCGESRVASMASRGGWPPRVLHPPEGALGGSRGVESCSWEGRAGRRGGQGQLGSDGR